MGEEEPTSGTGNGSVERRGRGISREVLADSYEPAGLVEVAAVEGGAKKSGSADTCP